MPGSAAREQRDRRVLLALDLDHAHPARAEAGQLWLVAQRRDLDPVVAADLEDRLPLAARDLLARRPRLVKAGADCGRCGDWVSSRRSTGHVGGGLDSRSGRGSVSVMRVVAGVMAGLATTHRVAHAGRAGAVREVRVELVREVSHPARAAGWVRRISCPHRAPSRTSAARSQQVWRSVGRGRPAVARCRSRTAGGRRSGTGCVLPHDSSDRKRSSMRGQVDDAGVAGRRRRSSPPRDRAPRVERGDAVYRRVERRWRQEATGRATDEHRLQGVLAMTPPARSRISRRRACPAAPRRCPAWRPRP